jgi:hypothetical protein
VQSASSVLGPWFDLPSSATNAASARVELIVPLGPGEAVFYRIRLTGP